MRRVETFGTALCGKAGRSASTSLVVALMLSTLAVPAAAEEIELGPHLETRLEQGILWVDAVVPEMGTERLVINLSAPRPSGRRVFWQRCEFGYAGVGIYSCGFEIGAGSDAAQQLGEWAARLVSDDGVLDRLTFDVPAVRRTCRSSARYRRQHRAACARALRRS